MIYPVVVRVTQIILISAGETTEAWIKLFTFRKKSHLFSENPFFLICSIKAFPIKMTKSAGKGQKWNIDSVGNEIKAN